MISEVEKMKPKGMNADDTEASHGVKRSAESLDPRRGFIFIIRYIFQYIAIKEFIHMLYIYDNL